MIDIDVTLKRKHFTLAVQFSLQERVTGLFGPSGAGKSTLLNMIAGLITPDSGHIRIDSQYLFSQREKINVPLHHRHVGLVFQDSRLFPHLTIEDNLCFGLKRLPPGQQRFTLEQITDLLEIGHLRGQRPHQLSGGEQQRVAIGRSLLSSPRILLLDEPLASLDVRLKNQILPFLKKVALEINIPMIYISHDRQEIQQITPNIVYIEDGRLRPPQS